MALARRPRSRPGGGGRQLEEATNLLVGSKRRIAGLGLAATDVDWTYGEGPEVRGPMVSLLLAMVGRPTAGELSGDGATTLAERA